MATLLAACVVRALRDDDGAVGTTAIDKRAVAGDVRVRRLGLHADVQADRKHHGGVDKAVYAFAEEDARFWHGELGRDLSPGWFGENPRTEGIDVPGAGQATLAGRFGRPRCAVGGDDGARAVPNLRALGRWRG